MRAARPSVRRDSQANRSLDPTRRQRVRCSTDDQLAPDGDIIDIDLNVSYDSMMRTTLTIDDDLAGQIDERRRRDGLSLKQVVNGLLREGLRSGRQAPRAKKYRTKPHKLGMRAGFDPARLNQLADELETDAQLERVAEFRR